jgi:hypothetical protein
MRRFILLLTFVTFAGSLAFSQDTVDTVKKDTVWKTGGQFVLTFSQASFTNWSAGGENAYSGNTRISLFANYAKNRTVWDNNLDFAYGKTKQDGLSLRKTDDNLQLNSKFGIKASKRWNYAGVFNAKTQVDAGYKYFDNDSSEQISGFLSPLAINLAIGADYKPNEHMSLFISPVNFKNVSVRDTVKYAKRNSIEPGKFSKTDFGAIMKFKYEKELISNINFMTKMDIFADYLRLDSFKAIDVDWEVLITMRVFKVITVNFNTNLIWDQDTKTEDPDAPDGLGPAKIQYKQIFGAGLTYKF